MPAPTDEVSVFREHLERYRGVTLQTLELVSEEKLSWRPAEGLRSFAESFLHIAQTEEFYAHGLFESDWRFDRLKLPEGGLARATLLERLANARAFTLEKLGALDPTWLEYIVPVPNLPVHWPLRSWLWYILEHEIHHKAQLALYLRQIGIMPPFFAYVLPPGARPDLI
jgi:uncharacterized damage-inducible protein DinB